MKETFTLEKICSKIKWVTLSAVSFPSKEVFKQELGEHEAEAVIGIGLVISETQRLALGFWTEFHI